MPAARCVGPACLAFCIALIDIASRQARLPTRFVAQLPARDELLLRRPKRWARCAVVGNSAILTGAGFGSAIDAHDAVFRFNYPPLDEPFARDVGRKVDFMFTGASTWFASRHAPFMRWDSYSDARRNCAMTVLLFTHADLNDTLAHFAEWRAMAPPPGTALQLRLVSPFVKELANAALRHYAEQNLPLEGASMAWRSTTSQALTDDDDNDNRASECSRRAVQSDFGCVCVRADRLTAHLFLCPPKKKGLRGVLASLLMCEHTTVYGFGTSAALGNGHYYRCAAIERVVFAVCCLFCCVAKRKIKSSNQTQRRRRGRRARESRSQLLDRVCVDQSSGAHQRASVRRVVERKSNI